MLITGCFRCTLFVVSRCREAIATVATNFIKPAHPGTRFPLWHRVIWLLTFLYIEFCSVRWWSHSPGSHIGCIVVIFITDSHIPQRVSPNGLTKPLTFHLPPRLSVVRNAQVRSSTLIINHPGVPIILLNHLFSHPWPRFLTDTLQMSWRVCWLLLYDELKMSYPGHWRWTMIS